MKPHGTISKQRGEVPKRPNDAYRITQSKLDEMIRLLKLSISKGKGKRESKA